MRATQRFDFHEIITPLCARSRCRRNAVERFGFMLVLACAFAAGAWAQQPHSSVTTNAPSRLVHRPPPASAVSPAAPQMIPLVVPKGTPLQVVLDRQLRVKKAGQSVQGRVIEPVYAFDKLVIPVGSRVEGKIVRISGISAERRTFAALDADFSPARKVRVEFSGLTLPTGRHIPIQTVVTPDSGKVIQFVSTGTAKKKGWIENAASKKIKEAKEQARHEWTSALKQVKEPGKLHRLEHFVIGELPVHPQYIKAGTVYFAELRAPLDFGTERLTPRMAASIAHPTLPAGSVVHARLLTPLNSGTTRWGAHVKAVVTRPLFDHKRLVIPEGSILKGAVVQVQPARRLSRNGELRPAFHELSLPDGIQQRVEATLAGLQSAKTQNVMLDAEGGARATTPKSRYLSTAVAVGLAAASQGDDVANRAEGGAGGFRLVGIALGIAVRSQPLGIAMGALGASRSIYDHFLARGRNVVLPKDTAMNISIGPQLAPANTARNDPANP